MNSTASTVSPTTTPTSTTLSIDGMSCGHCVAQVTKALSGVPGVEVKSVAVGSAQIAATDPADGGAAVKAALASLAEAGYPARSTQPAAVSSPGNVPKSGGCCGGSGAASASANLKAAGGKTSCCG